MKKQYVRTLAKGAQVDGDFLAYDIQRRTNRDGSPYLTMMLRDKTGAIRAVFWAFSEEKHASLPRECYMSIRGTVGEYNNAPQMRIASFKMLKPSEIDPSDFLPETTSDRSELLAKIERIISGIHDSHLCALLTSFFSDEEFLKEFMRAPAAVSIHHAYIGGLIEHTLGVARVAEALSEIYPDLDADILKAGALLHDVGKIYEYDYLTSLGFSTMGRMKGHHVLGCEMLRDKAGKLEGFPEKLLLKLEHMILSHHGTPEWGSPVMPMFTEAALLHFADNIDARYHVYAGAAPDSPGSEWSAYDKQLGHYIYVGPNE